jgi:hypothetical protein
MPVHGRWFAYAAWATATKNKAGNDHKSNDEHGTTLHSLSSLMLLADLNAAATMVQFWLADPM